MTRLLLIILLLLSGQFFFIVSKENSDLSDPLQEKRVVVLYFSWFGSAYDNFFEVTGNVIKTDWFGYNSTNLTYS